MGATLSALVEGSDILALQPAVPETWVDNDIPGLLAFFDAALKLERPRRLKSHGNHE